MQQIRKKGRPVGPDKSDHILAVATQQFSTSGYRAVKMNVVAELAGVSTRTLYKNYADKLSLFRASLESNIVLFPTFEASHGGNIREQLINFAIAFLTQLSSPAQFQQLVWIYRERHEFPEMLAEVEQKTDKYIVQPLARHLRSAGLEKSRSIKRTRLLAWMIEFESFQRTMLKMRPLTKKEISDHAELVIDIFINGAHLK